MRFRFTIAPAVALLLPLSFSQALATTPSSSPSAAATASPSAQPVSTMAPTVAVIDSGVPTNLFPNIVDEVCILEYSLCPNGKSVMDGLGAANIASSTNMTLTHGTEMLSIISKVNPNAKVIPIRIVGVTPNGLPYLYSNNAVKLALDWVIANRVKYNITVVNVSQGKIFPGCAVPAGAAQDVAVLKANNVAVIASAGNDSNRTAMDSIACLPDVVSVGATDNPDPGITGKPYDPTAKPYIARYSNGTPLTSFYLNARWYVLQPSGKTKFYVGSSNATAAMSGWWSLNYQGSWQATFDYMVKSAKATSNEWLAGRYIELPFALDK
jgi:Subtilase family